MKKIISVFLAIVMIVAMLSITASAASERPKAAYRVNWKEFSYTSDWYNEKKNDMSSNFTVTKGENSITSVAKSGCERRAYYSKTMYDISENTKYEYVFQAKNNRDYGYCGVIFAYANKLAYFMYGSFNNVSDDPNDGKCDIRVVKGLNQHDSKNCSTGFTRSYVTADVDSEGFGTFKVVINGFNATFFVLTNASNGTYTQAGNSITLPDDAKLTVGLFNREGSGSSQRTVTIRNAVVYAMNDAAAANIASVSDGSYEFLSYIDEMMAKHPKVNYTSSSYADFIDVIEKAEDAINSGNISTSILEGFKADLESAIASLELKEADVSLLEEAIEKAEAIQEDRYTLTTYKMLLNAIEVANEVLGNPEATQFDVDEAIKLIEARITALIPYEGMPPIEEETEESTEATEEPATEEIVIDTGVATETTFDDLVASADIGCKSSVAVSALAAVAIIGTAFALKKKED